MKNSVFKCFGITPGDIKSTLSEIYANSEGVLITLVADGAEVAIKLEADDNNVNFMNISSKIYQHLQKFIYAEEDVSVYEAAFQLLKSNGLTLATAESITAGNVAANFVKNNAGASTVLLEGNVVYTDKAKMRMLNISEQVLKQHSAVSVETTYDMAKNCLAISGANIVIATTGYAGGDDFSENGLNFIAIGDKNKIDIYRNKFIGSRQEVIETVTLASYFYLIKKLRKNDFFLDKNIV